MGVLRKLVHSPNVMDRGQANFGEWTEATKRVARPIACPRDSVHGTGILEYMNA